MALLLIEGAEMLKVQAALPKPLAQLISEEILWQLRDML